MKWKFQRCFTVLALCFKIDRLLARNHLGCTKWVQPRGVVKKLFDCVFSVWKVGGFIVALLKELIQLLGKKGHVPSSALGLAQGHGSLANIVWKDQKLVKVTQIESVLDLNLQAHLIHGLRSLEVKPGHSGCSLGAISVLDSETV